MPEHDADVTGVIERRVEVGVVADRRRKFHINGRLFDEGRGHQTCVGLQARVGPGQERLDGRAGFAPVQVAQGHEVVQRAALEDSLKQGQQKLMKLKIDFYIPTFT